MGKSVAGSIVAFVFAAIFLGGGIWALYVYEMCRSFFGTSGLGAVCGEEEAAFVFSLVLGIILLLVGALAYPRKSKARRRKAASRDD